MLRAAGEAPPRRARGKELSHVGGLVGDEAESLRVSWTQPVLAEVDVAPDGHRVGAVPTGQLVGGAVVVHPHSGGVSAEHATELGVHVAR